MYSKFIFLGLGGSGGKTLRFLKRDISRWLEKNGQDPVIPKGWKFLHIDTPTNPDGDELNSLVPQIGADEYLGLIDVGINMGAVQQNLDSKKEFHPELGSWRVNPNAVSVPLTMGAGQYRAIGRTVAMWAANRIKNQIKQCVDGLSKGAVNTELDELYQAINGEEPESGEKRTFIVVVSSLAGGTGAGLMQDVCDIIRGMDVEFSDQIFGILYAAEAFDSLGADGTGGVQPNSLAAFSEVLNGYWYNGQSEVNDIFPMNPEITDAVLKSAGIPKRITRSGPNYPFLVGRRNTGGIDYETPTKLFEMIGSSLLSWLTSPMVAKEFLAYTITNWDALAEGRESKDSTDYLTNAGDPDIGEPGLSAVSGLGFGRLSVGTEYFEEYAMQRIVRSTHSHAMNYHLYSDAADDASVIIGDDGAPDRTNDPEEISRRIASKNITHFMRKAKLDEIGPDANDIIDRLNPPSRDEIEGQLDSGIRNLSGVNQEGKAQSADEWIRSISDGFTILKEDYHKKFNEGLDAQSRKWVKEIQDDVLKAAEDSISKIGLSATSQLCFLVADKLENDTTINLHQEAAQDKEWANNALEYGLVNLQGVSGQLPNQAQVLSEAIAETKRVACFFGNYLQKERAEKLCVELARGFLRPLGNSIREAQRTAEFEWADSSNGEAPIASFVPWNNESPPNALRPPVSEYTLIDPDTYPEKFEELALEQLKSEGSDDIQIEIQRAILCSDWIRETQDTEKQSIRDLLTLTAESSWKPDATWLDDSSRNLRVAVRTDKNSLIKRTRFWLRQPSYPIGTFLNTSLRSFLGDDELLTAVQLSPSEKESRKVRFESQFKAAMQSSEPLINIDNNCFQQVHDVSGQNGVDLYYAFSEIPLDAHPVGEGLKKYLGTIYGDKQLPDFNIDATISHINITTAIEAPVSPLVVDSIWAPIAQAYQMASADDGNGMNSFWLRRRSRTHQRFIPAPQQTIIAMIRGWIAASYLGLLGDSQLEPNPGVLSIGLDGPTKSADFPYPLLSEVHAVTDELPAVLEALPLSYMHCNTQNSLDPLKPYIRLRDLGKSPGGAQLYGYANLSAELRNWVDTGTLPKNTLSKSSLELEEGVQTPEDRIKLLSSKLTARLDRLEEMHDQVTGNAPAAPTLLTTSDFLGLYDLLEQAIIQMQGAASKALVQLSSPTQGDR